MRKLLILLTICFYLPAEAQISDTLILEKNEAERLLLANNLQLLANQLNIDKSEADLIQAKVWPNPELEIDEVNLWTTTYQKRTGEQLPPLFGSESFGKFRQVSARIEQLVETAGKRKKRIAIAQVDRSLAISYLEDFLLSLKVEFRKLIYNYSYSEAYLELLEHQLESITGLVSSYQRQYELGNINKYEVIRLKSIQLQLKDEIIDQREDLNEHQAALIVLLNLPDNTELSFSKVFRDDYAYELEFIPDLEYLKSNALLNRPDVNIFKLDKELASKELDYERALRVPDVSFSVGYDRGGNILQDFVGVGLSVDLPIFDRNKGGVRKAELNVIQADYAQQEHLKRVNAEVTEKHKNLLQTRSFFSDIDSAYVDDLDISIEVYTKNFRNQAVNMLEYLDFLEAYMDNKQIILENQKQFMDALEELRFVTGLELE